MEREKEMEMEKEKEKENSSIAAKDINNSNGEAVKAAAAADFSSFLEKMRKDFLPRAETILWECYNNTNRQPEQYYWTARAMLTDS